MPTPYPELRTWREFQGLILPTHPTSGTEDDDDDRDDEHAGENEAPGRAVDENTETPEEFEIDDKAGDEVTEFLLCLIRQSDESAVNDFIENANGHSEL